MVDTLKTIIPLITADKRQVLLFAVLKIDDVTDRWSIIYSESTIVDEASRKETFLYLVNTLLSNLTEAEARSIARVAVLPPTNHLVENLLRFKTGYEITESTPVNGNIVHEGSILISKT